MEAGLRRRVVNIGHLLSGNGLTGAIALLSVAITARSLGPLDYGILALVVSYSRVFDRLMRFESWQPLIKYAAAIDASQADGRDKLRALFAFGLWLDVAACFTAAVMAALLAVLFGPIFGLSEHHILLVFISCAGLLFNISGMPTAVLRLAGNFRTIAYVQVSASLIRVVLSGIGLWYGGGLLYFVAVWTISQIISSLLFLAIAWAELRRQNIKALHRVPLRGITRPFPGIMGFAWSSSLSISIRSSAMELDVLVVGALADPRSAGLYFMVKQVAKAVQQVCGQVQAVLYPDVARLWAQRSFAAFKRALVQVQMLLDVFALAAIAILAVGAPLLIKYGVGAEFAPAYPLLLVQIVALAFTMHAAPLRSALLAMGEQRAVLNVAMSSIILFQVLLFALVPWIGPMGANIAHVALATTSAIAMELCLRRKLSFALSKNGPPPACG